MQENQRASSTTPTLLADGVEVRVKASQELMHFKSYVIDGTLLRTGSANWSPTGLKRQDNDVHYEVDKTLAALFETRFEAMWDRATNRMATTPPAVGRGAGSEAWLPCFARSAGDALAVVLGFLGRALRAGERDCYETLDQKMMPLTRRTSWRETSDQVTRSALACLHQSTLTPRSGGGRRLKALS
jgi:hypothetical protein